MNRPICIAFVGNPNCGKTTLFNAYTGANLKVANWPGVTVERIEGETDYKGQKVTLLDLPGIYSLTSYSIEEKVARNAILDDEVDVIVNIVDASAMERNLYLTMQLLEMGKPVVLALNMMDIVEERGMEIDLHRLPEMLGNIPVVPVSARKRSGLDVLMHAVKHHFQEAHTDYVMKYSDEVEEKISQMEEILKTEWPEDTNRRWHAIKLLENDEEILKDHPVNVKQVVDKDYEKIIINQKYDYIEEIVEETLFYKNAKEAFTEKVDRILTHPFWGVPVFLGIMMLVFMLTFTLGDSIAGAFEGVMEQLFAGTTHILTMLHTSDWLISLVVDGIMAGVGGILTFLPNIFILFVALAILEDSGYMARVAYVMDGIMSRFGLSGKAFLPMVLGFGCTVPAVMATRTLEKESDRRKAIILTPFMSCSAKLPIYVLFAGMFFGTYASLAALSMYVFGLVMAIVVAILLTKWEKRKHEVPLLIELPEYKMPNTRTVAIYVWEKVKDYLVKAGTTIFVASIIIWFILNFGMHGMVTDVSESFGAILGRWMEPILAPAGLGMWQIGVALISGLSAKEVVISSLAVLFGIQNINSATGMNAMVSILGEMGFTSLNACALMVFCLLYTPCMAAVATIRKETKSTKWTLTMSLAQLILAYIVTILVFQVGSLFVG